jgi:hypothetical protein
MSVRQVRSGEPIDVSGTLPTVLHLRDKDFLTTTVFVKYNYTEIESQANELDSITVAALPNGLLQDLDNPDPKDTIWLAGRNAPSRGEAFRVRLSFTRLKAKAIWRVQNIPASPEEFPWAE